MMFPRRTLIAAAVGTLASAAWPRKPLAEDLPPLSRNLVRIDPPAQPPDVPFFDADDKEHRLSDFKGRGMVVNLWATWCVPCVHEMPSLENAAKALAPDDIAVLPLASDRGGPSKVSDWFEEHHITGLPVLMDPKGKLAMAFVAHGIPTTFVINKSGLVVARLEGAADWGAPEAVELIKALVAG